MFVKPPVLSTILLLLAFGLFCSSCKKEQLKDDNIEYGPSINLGDGKAKTFVEVDDNGTPVKVGVKFSAAALTNLPAGDPSFTLQFPSDMDLTPFDHLTINWSDHGHDPSSPYHEPHFGFHFYYMTMDERNKIGANDTTQFKHTPDPEYLPDNYAHNPEGVPYMGTHWVDLESPEFNGGDFTSTFIIGSYDGEINFLEPMITLEYLLTKPDQTFELRQPADYQAKGYHPMSYLVRYDAEKDEFTVALSDLMMRQ